MCFVYTLSNLMHKNPVLYVEQEQINFITDKSQVRGIPGSVQWLGLCALTAEGPGSMPGQGTNIPQAM